MVSEEDLLLCVVEEAVRDERAKHRARVSRRDGEPWNSRDLVQSYKRREHSSANKGHKEERRRRRRRTKIMRRRRAFRPRRKTPRAEQLEWKVFIK